MSILMTIIINFFVIIYSVNIASVLSSATIIDCEIGDIDVVIPCPIDRTQWTLPSILQWYRSNNSYTKPIASQFDNYPVHIDDIYRNKYSLLSNGSLKIENVQLNDNDTFECRLILIDRGLLDVKSNNFVTLRVNEQPYFIKLSNSLQIVSHYSTVNFICQIYGVPVPIVKWYKIIEKNKQYTSKDENLELLITDSQQFTLRNVDDRMAGKYRCVGKNRLGTIQNDFQLLIRGSIYWRRFPESQTVKINDSVILKCEGESSEKLQYQWLKDDLPVLDTISSRDRIQTYSDGVLSIHNIEPSDHGFYVCIINTLNSAGVRSKPAVITVKYPPMPSRSHQAKNLTFIRGSTGICPCLLDAYPSIQLPSPQESCTDSTISLAKVTTIPRCRDSIISNTIITPQLKRISLCIDNPNSVVGSTVTFAANDETKMASFFEPILANNISPIPYADIDNRKTGSRLPLEAVPEINELDVANSRYSFDPSILSILPNSHYSRTVQPSPVLITFDSSTLKFRT